MRICYAKRCARRAIALFVLCALILPVCAAAAWADNAPRLSDVETSADWRASIDTCMRTGEWRRDLIEVAKTQLGYRESTTNTVVRNGVTYGYTRYGDFMDDSESVVYGPWCASFVSFCLYYAEVKAMPRSSGCAAMLRKIDNAGYFRPAGEYEPRPGDLIFFYSGKEADAEKLKAGHMGIITAIEDGVVTTIEGGREIVMYFKHDLAEEAWKILGYAELPDNPDYRTVTDETGTVSISGLLPEDVEIRTSPYTAEEKEAIGLDSATFSCAMDVTLYVGEKEYQPKRPVSFSINAMGLEDNSFTAVQISQDPQSGKLLKWPVYYIKADSSVVSFVNWFVDGFAITWEKTGDSGKPIEQHH